MRLNKASILIVSLWIVSLLSLMALGLGFRSSLEVRLASYNLDSLRARYLAKAGMVKTKIYLSQDTKPYDSLYECGIQIRRELPEDIFRQKVGQGSFLVSYQLAAQDSAEKLLIYGPSDEERKINLNLSKLGLGKEEFRNILLRLSDNLNEEIINAIIDWQDADSSVSLPGGAEDSQYRFLDNPYECRDSDFKTLEELLLVRGVDFKLFKEIADYLTVYGEGKININTASKKVLAAVIDDASANFAGLVEAIVRYRQGQDGREATADDNHFSSMEEVKLLAQSSAEMIRLNSLAKLFAFKSSNFRVTVQGNANRVVKSISCVLKKEPHSKQVSLVCYHED